MNLIKKIDHLISCDFRNSKPFKEQDELMQVQQILVHNSIFLTISFFAILYLIDHYFLDKYFANAIIEWLSLIPPWNNGYPLFIFYLFSTMLSLIISSAFAVYFFVKYSKVQTRRDLIPFVFFGDLIPSIYTILMGLLCVGIFWFGGFLMAIKLPYHSVLGWIPGIFLFQFYLIAKAQAFLSATLTYIFYILMPFELRKRLRKVLRS